MNDIDIVYASSQKQKDYLKNPFDFTLNEDRVYALSMYKYTYGYWDLVRNEVRNCSALTFNWAVFSRTTDDIKKRCDFLI